MNDTYERDEDTLRKQEHGANGFIFILAPASCLDLEHLINTYSFKTQPLLLKKHIIFCKEILF